MRGLIRGASLAVLLVASAVGAADGPIRLPVFPVVPDKMPPAPAPDAPIRLAGDSLFVIDSDVPVIALASPANLVLVTEEVGPLRVRGKFVDGNGRTETRNFKGKHVITVEAAVSGKCELLIVPVGATKAADVIRRTLDVDAGQGPIPPPIPPKPEPSPEPKPKPEPKQAVAWVIVVEETGDRTPEVAKVLGDLAWWDGLKKRTPPIERRFYDDDHKDAKIRNYDVFGKEVGFPAVLLLAADGKVIDKFKLPATTAEIDAKLGGAK